MPSILTNQRLSSDDGYRIVAVPVSDADRNNDLHPTKYYGEFQRIKKWCRETCSGTWGFTPVPNVSSSYNQHTHRVKRTVIYYIAFTDHEDVLALKYFSDLASHNVVWPTGTKFTMFVND